MSAKSWVNLSIRSGISVLILAIGIHIVNNLNRQPVGIPRPYTTFITDNSTATPILETTTPFPQTPICLGQNLQVGDFLAFRIWMPHADKELFRMDVDGTNACQLTMNTIADDQPSISPDGAKIAFVSFDEVYRPGIYIMKSDGTNHTRLTSGGSAYSFPDWSPDGMQLVFQATINELFDLYAINISGTNLRNLTNDVTLDTTPSWSPDGKRIAFASDRTFDPKGYVEQGNSYEIYVMDSDGSNVHRLTNNERTDISPEWSPDGQKIAFVSDSELYVINVDGTDLRQLTNSDRFFANSPIWLPDGQHIAFASGTIYIINPEDLNVQPLLPGIPGVRITQIDGWWR